MAVLEIIARYSHVGHLEEYKNGEVRPVCDSCEYKGPKFIAADRVLAMSGLEAHIAIEKTKHNNQNTYEMWWAPHRSVLVDRTGRTICGAEWTWDWNLVVWTENITEVWNQSSG